MGKNANPVKRLREELGLTQIELADASGVGYHSLCQYEADRKISETALDKLRTFAIQRDRPDLAVLFGSAPFRVRRIFEAAPHPSTGAALDLHTLLDEILQSGDPTATLAVENLLAITAQYLRRPK